MTTLVTIRWRDYLYLVRVPAHLTSQQMYDCARKSLGVPDNDVTPWQEVRFNGNIARLGR